MILAVAASRYARALADTVLAPGSDASACGGELRPMVHLESTGPEVRQ